MNSSSGLRLICVFRFLDKKRKVMRLWTGTEFTYYAVKGRYAISGFCDTIEGAVNGQGLPWGEHVSA